MMDLKAPDVMYSTSLLLFAVLEISAKSYVLCGFLKAIKTASPVALLCQGQMSLSSPEYQSAEGQKMRHG